VKAHQWLISKHQEYWEAQRGKDVVKVWLSFYDLDEVKQGVWRPAVAKLVTSASTKSARAHAQSASTAASIDAMARLPAYSNYQE
jgi:hypothetical protein